MKKVSDLMKEIRGNQTQQKTAGEMHVARETISRYETGKDKVNVDVANKYSKKYDDPRFAMTVQSEYTGTGPVWLDGPNADLHRSAIKEKTLEELEEAFSSLKDTCLSKPLRNLQTFEIQKVQDSLEELVEASTAISQLVAVICMEAGISYRDLWSNHYHYLASEGYLGGIR